MLTALASSCSIAPTPPRTLPPITGNACALGYDFGTSGVRCAIVDASGETVANPPGSSWGVAGERVQAASDWEEALFSQLAALPADARARVSRIAVSGTSGSMLLVDGDGAPAASRGSSLTTACGETEYSSQFQSERARRNASASATACSRMPAVPSLTTKIWAGPAVPVPCSLALLSGIAACPP